MNLQTKKTKVSKNPLNQHAKKGLIQGLIFDFSRSFSQSKMALNQLQTDRNAELQKQSLKRNNLEVVADEVCSSSIRKTSLDNKINTTKMKFKFKKQTECKISVF